MVQCAGQMAGLIATDLAGIEGTTHSLLQFGQAVCKLGYGRLAHLNGLDKLGLYIAQTTRNSLDLFGTERSVTGTLYRRFDISNGGQLALKSGSVICGQLIGAEILVTYLRQLQLQCIDIGKGTLLGGNRLLQVCCYTINSLGVYQALGKRKWLARGPALYHRIRNGIKLTA